MKRILVTGAGGSPATNFVRSLRASREPYYLIGVDADAYNLQRAETDERHLVPLASDSDYFDILTQIGAETRAEFLHSQNDKEIAVLSAARQRFSSLGIRMFLPKHETVLVCQNKFASYEKWKEAGLRVPETMMIQDQADLEKAFQRFGSPIWLRAVVGAAGRHAFPAKTMAQACAWLDFHDGWGAFSGAECIERDSVTWMSIWKSGELLVAQSRKRLYWELGDRAPSGVTGITGAAVTVDDDVVTRVAIDAIRAIDQQPHGIFSVDLTYDSHGVPNPTEINIARFFTTHYFFTVAGLNMPELYLMAAFDETLPALSRKINPLTSGLVWIRGVDFEPVLTDERRMGMYVNELADRRRSSQQ